jgi:hypothetical protein
MRYVPSTSKVPSARMVGRGNWPCPHPTARLHPVSVTERQALSPVHRPVARGPSLGPVGLRLQASRPLPATSAATSTRAGRRLMPRYNAARDQDQNAPTRRPDADLTSPGAPGGPALCSLPPWPRYQRSVRTRKCRWSAARAPRNARCPSHPRPSLESRTRSRPWAAIQSPWRYGGQSRGLVQQGYPHWLRGGACPTSSSSADETLFVNLGTP